MNAKDNLTRAFELIDAHRNELRLVGPPPPQTIETAEGLLDIQFPPSYRAFVEREGAGSIKGREIYGVVPDLHAPGPPNVVWRTLDSRASASLPDRYLIIVDFDDSSAIALDTSQRRSDGEASVVRIWPGEVESELVDSELASDFGSFLLRFVEERVKL